MLVIASIFLYLPNLLLFFLFFQILIKTSIAKELSYILLTYSQRSMPSGLSPAA